MFEIFGHFYHKLCCNSQFSDFTRSVWVGMWLVLPNLEQEVWVWVPLEVKFSSFIAFHCTEPFIITLPWSWHDLYKVERIVKHQIFISWFNKVWFCHLFNFSTTSTSLQQPFLYHLNDDCLFVCLCWGFTAQSTQKGHVERGQFTKPHVYWAGLVL